jgi:hypothetical protein
VVALAKDIVIFKKLILSLVVSLSQTLPASSSLLNASPCLLTQHQPSAIQQEQHTGSTLPTRSASSLTLPAPRPAIQQEQHSANTLPITPCVVTHPEWMPPHHCTFRQFRATTSLLLTVTMPSLCRFHNLHRFPLPPTLGGFAVAYTLTQRHSST